MNTLFDLETIPTNDGTPKPKVKAFYYIYVLDDGVEWFVWKTHSNGGAEWCKRSDHPKRKPLRYKTHSGAKRQASWYSSDGLVGVWKD